MSAHPPELRFFRNYNRTVGAAYAALLLVLAGFFAQQLRINLGDEIASIQGHLDRHHQFLEFVLRASADEVDGLRMAAASSVARQPGQPRLCETWRPAQVRAAGLSERVAGGFDRDALADPDSGSNLVGQGRLSGRSPDFHCDLAAALALDARLQSLAFQRPQAARTRFVSAQGFHMVAPWQPAHQVPFSPRVFNDPVWRMGLPAENPERLKFWGPSFFGGQEVGLLVPVAAPVYERDRFMGVVSLDISLDHLHRANGSFGYPRGSVAVVDAEGTVLAHPGVFVDPLSVRTPHRLLHLFEPGLLPSVQALEQLPDGRPVDRDGWTVVRRGFSAAPWHLVYAVPRLELWIHLLRERAPAMMAMLLGMGVLMVLVYAVSSREFVTPATRLVEHLMAESSLRPQPVPPVPRAWRPWFEAVTQGFRQSLELNTLRKELDIAADMQRSILPRHWPADPRYELWGSTVAAREVGGDFYDHFQMADGSRAIVVADVSGKGIAAGLFAMVAKTLMRAEATQRQAPPAEVAHHVNNGLCADNDASTFVTGVHGHYEPASGRLDYANAGHPPPLLVRGDGSCAWLAPTGGTALGVMEDLAYGQARIELGAGDTLVMYTDGVTEAQQPQGDPFGMQRLRALFEGRPPAHARDAVQRVMDAVRDFAQGCEPFDDVTCLALRCMRRGPAA